jgi:hypothetical protein
MQLTKSISVGGLSILVWMSGNWSGAIAEIVNVTPVFHWTLDKFEVSKGLTAYKKG